MLPGAAGDSRRVVGEKRALATVCFIPVHLMSHLPLLTGQCFYLQALSYIRGARRAWTRPRLHGRYQRVYYANIRSVPRHLAVTGRQAAAWRIRPPLRPTRGQSGVCKPVALKSIRHVAQSTASATVLTSAGFDFRVAR